MRVFDTNVQLIKYNVLKEIAKITFEERFQDIIKIPEKIIPGPKPIGRCCIYKERAIISKRTEIAMGDNDDNKGHVQVLKIACDECPIGGYEISGACRGCLAHRCKDACPKNAIQIINQKAVIDKEKCIECGKCKAACPYGAIIEISRPCVTACQTNAISIDKEHKAQIEHEKCVGCGACVYSCPFGAIVDKTNIVDVINIIKSEYRIYGIIAPSISTQFDYASIGQVVNGIKELGFHSVVEAALGADLTALEEAKELKQREKLISSCCPSFVEYIEKFIPEMNDLVSKTKSPMLKTAKLIKKTDNEAKIIFIGPCISKKHEAKNTDIDYVITFEELQALLDAKGILIEKMGEAPLNNSSYYGRIFAMKGGLSEAIKKASELEDINILQIDGIKNIKKNLLLAKLGKIKFDFIEGMACEGGCIGGPSCLHHGKKDRKEVEKYAKDAIEVSMTKSGEIFEILE